MKPLCLDLSEKPVMLMSDILQRIQDAYRRNPAEALQLIPELCDSIETGEISDGYHTFNELYHHRAILFSAICNTYSELAWKSKKHSDGTMFEGDFIVGIQTPKGTASYHYAIYPYWDMFHVKEIPNAPEWDGYTPAESIDRIYSLSIQTMEYEESENFIQTKFGYCFYNLDLNPVIYNLYVYPQYRKCGHSRTLLELVIKEIRKSGYKGKIFIEAKPKEDSIELSDLTKYYKSMGLEIYES